MPKVVGTAVFHTLYGFQPFFIEKLCYVLAFKLKLIKKKENKKRNKIKVGKHPKHKS